MYQSDHIIQQKLYFVVFSKPLVNIFFSKTTNVTIDSSVIIMCICGKSVTLKQYSMLLGVSYLPSAIS